ncbi:MAG: hypothetical protein ACXVPY_05750, partial [Bacteroidia bacterium]
MNNNQTVGGSPRQKLTPEELIQKLEELQLNIQECVGGLIGKFREETNGAVFFSANDGLFLKGYPPYKLNAAFWSGKMYSDEEIRWLN